MKSSDKFASFKVFVIFCACQQTSHQVDFHLDFVLVETMSFDAAVDLTISTLRVQDTRCVQDTRSLKESLSSNPKKKKASVLPTFLPPCRVCNATASGYHYGELVTPARTILLEYLLFWLFYY